MSGAYRKRGEDVSETVGGVLWHPESGRSGAVRRENAGIVLSAKSSNNRVAVFLASSAV
jgi:hypothetical protein